ncbi:MipA/OmpV family protein [Sphingomonas sp. BT-65]|uniref:MipA/OmpV family protein n=1 Tax=Sphingomonas sp. BT-65 TaxID=2989821 RepID=UPI002235DBF8|nr:MipA/OmpV family protein [Sphingomonas sp. BT-65]MCW4461199.1 MipA/OmpV family protein [Sphingomonas sp. BT-65]
MPDKMLPPLMPIVLLLLPAPALAQAADETAPPEEEGWSGFVAIGPALAPRFEGSDEYRLVPFAIGTVRNGGVSVDLRGSQLRADIVPADRLALGPLVNVRLGRDSDAGGRVGVLDEIDAAVELGGFVGIRLGGDRTGQGQLQLDLTAIADVSGTHDGVLVTGGVTYLALRTQRFSLALDTQATWGDGAYTRTYFGITPGEATRSGLAAYDPGASLRDAGAGVTIGYQFDRRWGLLGRLGWSYLLGDAADSPIVRDEGSRHQGVAGLALSYRF